MGRHYLAFVALLVVGCASSAPIVESDLTSTNSDLPSTSTLSGEPEQVEVTDETSEVAARRSDLVEGTATAFRRFSLEETESGQDPEFGPVDGVELVGCRWRAPGLYSFDMTWSPTEPADWPVTILVGQGIIRGDTGFGWGGFVTLAGPGDFSVPHDIYAVAQLLEGQRDGRIEVSAHGSDLDRELAGSCFLGGSDLETRAEITVDLLATEVGAPGTVEEFVGQIDLFDEGSPLRPLAVFAPQVDQFGIDRLFIAPDGPLDFIAASLRDGCLSIRSSYLIETDTTFRVDQRLRCPSDVSPEPGETVVIADDVWMVRVIGPSDLVEAFAASVEDVPFDGVPRLAAGEGTFDATAALDAAIQESTFTEIARVPWEDGLVAIGFHNHEFSGERYADPIVAVPERFGGGGSGTGCEDFAISEQGDATRGFGFVVVENADHDVVQLIDGQRVVVESIPATGGRAVVFFDMKQQPNITTASLSVIDENGQTVPCVQ